MDSFDIEAVIKNFDVNAYAETRGWGVCEWEFALSRRRMIIREPDGYKERHDVGVLINGLLGSALLSSPVQEGKPFDPTVTNLSNYAAWGFKEIVESRADIAAECSKESDGPAAFQSEHEEGSDEWFRELFRSVEDTRSSDVLFGSFNKLLVEGPFESDTAYVQVLLSAPDEIIVADFRRWLKSIRNDAAFEHSPVRRFTEAEIRRWSSNQVLPFLDLRLAMWAAGKEVPYHVVGELLFPGLDVDVAEKTRKVTAPLADELMTWDLGEALSAAANAHRRSGMNL